MTDEAKIVATGTWFYDRTVPRQIWIYAKPAHMAWSRFDDNDQLDESRPIPKTKDGFLYFCFPAKSGEYLTIDEVKEWANAQPWGPIIWD